MTRGNISQENIRRARNEMTIERIQLLLTEEGWFKQDLAHYLNINLDQLNRLLCHECYAIDPQIARQVRQLRANNEKRLGRPSKHDINLFFPRWPFRKDQDHI